MSNQTITVKSALYGVPGKVVDVTAKVQGKFDLQYEKNNKTTAFALDSIQPSLFNISDPAPGTTKAFTIVYNLPAVGVDLFMRGAQDFQNLTLIAGPPRTIQVNQAIYASPNIGLDVTEKLAAYLRDPGNNSFLQIGAQRPFRDVLTDGADIDPNATKYFSISYTNTASPNQDTQKLCGYDGQTVNIS
jgi:hypothetical protein